MIKAGIDLGYNAVKVMSDRKVGMFPSVLGTPDRARFSLNGASQDLLLTVPGDGTWLVGEGAITQSRFATRREDRGWIESEEYYRLMLAALTEATAGSVEMKVVTGLPVAFYDDKESLQARFLGEHKAQREGRRSQTIRVTECRVIPQPFGTLLAVSLDEQGRIVNREMAEGSVAIIDVGGKTTNLLSVNRLAEIARETASINVGAWDVVRQVREYLADACPDLEMRDHEIVEAITQRRVKYFGEPLDLSEIVQAAVEPLAEQVIAQATQLWNAGARLDAVLVSGGGAHLVGRAIERHFRHAWVVENPVFANVTGYYRFAQRLR